MKLARPTPVRLALGLAVSSSALFLVAGYLGGRSHFVVDWTDFDDGSALLLLAAWAQLILAFAVWFQIRAAEQQRADAATHHVAAMGRANASAEWARVTQETDAIVSCAALTANASSMYQSAGRSLGAMTGDRKADPEEMASVDRDIDAAEGPRQAAVTALFQVAVLNGEDSAAYSACKAFWDGVNQQRRAAVSARQWFRAGHHLTSAQAPDAARATIDTQPLRQACLEEARALRKAAPTA